MAGLRQESEVVQVSSFIDRRENRELLQKALHNAKKLGGSPYYNGEIDGVLGGQSAAAIILYRKDHDLSAAAVIDSALLRSLNLSTGVFTPEGTPMSNILGSIFSGLFGNLLNWQLVQGYLRDGLKVLGAGLVTQGIITGSQLNDGVGAIMVVLSIVLSALSIPEFTLEPGTREWTDSRWFIACKSLPPAQVKEHFQLSWEPTAASATSRTAPPSATFRKGQSSKPKIRSTSRSTAAPSSWCRPRAANATPATAACSSTIPGSW